MRASQCLLLCRMQTWGRQKLQMRGSLLAALQGALQAATGWNKGTTGRVLGVAVVLHASSVARHSSNDIRELAPRTASAGRRADSRHRHPKTAPAPNHQDSVEIRIPPQRLPIHLQATVITTR